jgi:uncharacterized repeat protein (TIGR01451 family)
VKPAGGWASATETAKLTASDGAVGDVLGWSVAVSGGTIVAGAPRATVAGTYRQGAAYVFVEPAGGWKNATETAKLTAPDGASEDALGFSVGVAGTTVVAGSTDAKVGGNAVQGAAYVFGANGADLSITKSDSPDPVISGNQLTYTIVVTNNGPLDATGVTVTDRLSADVHYGLMSSTNGICTRSPATKNSPKDGTVTCRLGELTNSENASVTIVVTATKPGTLTNTASVSADQPDQVTDNNSATATTMVVE